MTVRIRSTVGRVGLVGRFALASGVAMLVLWLALIQLESARVRSRALDGAAASAEVLAKVALMPHLEPEDLTEGLEPAEVAELDAAFRTAVADGQIARVKIWSADGTIVYSDDAGLIGEVFPIAHDLREALEGEVEAELSSLDEAENVRERSFGRLLEVYLPIRFAAGGSREPAGAFELYVPYTPIEAAIASDARRLYVTLTVGLVLLWAVLFRLVVGAARRLKRDGEELRRRAEENRHLALYDQLTDLPNRVLFRDRLEQAIRSADRDGTRVGVLMLDLDRFREVNDTLGHDRGDEVLVQVGPRLRETLRAVDTVARLGGDEFGILLGGLHGLEDARAVAGKVSEALDRPFDLGDLELALGGGIGICVYPDHGDDVDPLIRRAEVAMYVAKAARAPFEVYAPEHDHHTRERLAMVAELRHAIESRELGLHFQPKIDLRRRRVVGVEALARWTHPDRGAIPPDEFISLAEHSGLIRRLTALVLDAALEQCRTWREAGIEMPVAVNLSTRDLLDEDLPEDVWTMLSRHGLEPHLLELEITEGSVMDQPARALEVLDRISSRGIELAIDDYGTGYSSLAYLQRLPVRQLKIDRSFVMRLRTSPSDAEIVRSTIDLGHGLGLTVVAEGVEDRESLEFLSDAGCDVAQGYHLAKPMPAEAFVAWLRDLGSTVAGRVPAS